MKEALWRDARLNRFYKQGCQILLFPNQTLTMLCANSYELGDLLLQEAFSLVLSQTFHPVYQ